MTRNTDVRLLTNDFFLGGKNNRVLLLNVAYNHATFTARQQQRAIDLCEIPHLQKGFHRMTLMAISAALSLPRWGPSGTAEICLYALGASCDPQLLLPAW